jgi:hypothetical protein
VKKEIVVSLSEDQEKKYLSGLELLSPNCLYSEPTQERIENVNGIWYLQPEDTPIPLEPGQKLDLIRKQRLLEKLKPKTIPTIIYLASVRASKN